MQPGAEDVDYCETVDLNEAHAVQREKQEPTAGFLPGPVWLLMSALGLFGIAGYYMGAYNGGFDASVYDERAGLSATETAAGGAGAGAATAAPETLAQQGKKVFTQNCVTCHQASGLGLPPAYPPLAGSEWVVGSEKRAIMILLTGLQGPVHVKGQAFNGAMPAWGGNLTDKKIAAVLTYVRSEWGNQAGEITPEQVAAVRKETASRAEPWGEADLLAVPADAKVEAAAQAK